MGSISNRSRIMRRLLSASRANTSRICGSSITEKETLSASIWSLSYMSKDVSVSLGSSMEVSINESSSIDIAPTPAATAPTPAAIPATSDNSASSFSAGSMSSSAGYSCKSSASRISSSVGFSEASSAIKPSSISSSSDSSSASSNAASSTSPSSETLSVFRPQASTSISPWCAYRCSTCVSNSSKASRANPSIELFSGFSVSNT